MLATDLFLKPASGFIATSPSGADTVAERRSTSLDAPASTPVSAATLTTLTADWALEVAERPTWQAPAGAGVRRVEVAIIGSICAFFAFGLASTLGLF